MKYVEPIRDKKKIKDLKTYLLGTGNIRNYSMIVLGMNIALRITDLLSLKWKDVLEADLITIRYSIQFHETKNKRNKTILFNNSAKEAIKRLMDDLGEINGEHYLFKSREGENKQIKRVMAWKIIKESCQAVGIRDNIGTHTLRKTWGYWANKNGASLSYIMEAFNHSSIEITKKYIGITQDEINNIYLNTEI